MGGDLPGDYRREPANGGAAIRCPSTRQLVMYLSGYKGASSDALARAWLDLKNWREEEIEKSGLMGLWDALAQQAEKLAERLDK